MKYLFFVLALAVCAGGVLLAQQHIAMANSDAVTATTVPIADHGPAAEAPLDYQAQPVGKKCGFDSDCPHGKCSGGQCGACGFDSDCKGWGKCSGGKCGACGFDSDCTSFGPCNSGKCAKSPY